MIKYDEELLKIISENEKLIYKIVHFFSNYESKEDLFQVGCIGLIKAYQNYKEGFNTKFTTYAYPYILGEIKKYIRDDKGIKISRDISKLNLRIEKANILLTQKLMREPTITELSNFLGIDEIYIADALASNNIIYSLDEPVECMDDSICLYDKISSIENLDKDTLIALKQELMSLDKKDYDIINSHYFKDLTQSEIADELGMNQVQVSRREKKILTKLKDKLAG